MKKEVVILFILLILIVVGAILFILLKNPTTSADFYSCTGDSDCVKATDGCCGCTQGGKMTSINKKYSNEWNLKLSKECSEIVCLTVISNDPSCNQNPKCVSGECVLV